MEIKKFGIDVESFKREINCETCSSELMVSSKDIRKDDEGNYFCYCGACQAILPLDNLHILLRQLVDKKI